MNQNNEVVAMLEAFEVQLWFDENPEAAAKLTDNLKALSALEETDNPVVIIAKLKE